MVVCDGHGVQAVAQQPAVTVPHARFSGLLVTVNCRGNAVLESVIDQSRFIRFMKYPGKSSDESRVQCGVEAVPLLAQCVCITGGRAREQRGGRRAHRAHCGPRRAHTCRHMREGRGPSKSNGEAKKVCESVCVCVCFGQSVHAAMFTTHFRRLFLLDGPGSGGATGAPVPRQRVAKTEVVESVNQ